MEYVIIGRVNSPITEPVDLNWGEVCSEIVLKPEYVPGLLGLEDFSHLLVLTILHKAEYIPEEHLVRRPQEREDMPLKGIFAQRARHRPNRQTFLSPYLPINMLKTYANDTIIKKTINKGKVDVNTSNFKTYST